MFTIQSKSEQNLDVPPNLNCVASLGGDALHGQDDLEGVLPDVPGTHTAIMTIDNNGGTRFAIDFQSAISCELVVE